VRRTCSARRAGTGAASDRPSPPANGSAFDAEFRRGGERTVDEAVTYALGDESAPAPGTRGDDVRLTRREREIAGLIAEGLTNRQIAARLVISQRTAESHVENILSKFGFTSRSQVAAWYTDQR
jgi:DNA-binding NarL/FixJ family response regulator